MKFFRSSYLHAFLIGAVMVLTQSPFYITPLFWLCLPCFLFLLQKQNSTWRIFLLGWLFGLGYFVFGLYWICVALTTDIAKFWYLMPFALFGLPAYFTIYWGLATIITKKITHYFARTQNIEIILLALIFPVFLTFAELARGHLLTGFPWNLPGYGWVGWLPILQSVSVIGIYGLTFLTVSAACLPLLFLALPRSKAIMINGTAIALFIGIGLWGWQRMQAHPTVYYPDYKFRLVQPNIPQGEKWDDQHRINNLNALLKLSIQDRAPYVTHVIWPETAVPFIINENDIVRTSLQSIVPPGGALLTGALRREWANNNSDEYTLFNSLQVLDSNGQIIGSYDKSHLVPFGEYMPLRKLIPLPAVAASFSDLGEGMGAETYHWGNLPPVSALICYEVIFPGDIVRKDKRPDWILNVTNDGWYGNTTGPHQHLAMAISRSVEEGLPMIRVANTGISAVIDPVGRIVAKTRLGERTFIDSQLPQPLK